MKDKQMNAFDEMNQVNIPDIWVNEIERWYKNKYIHNKHEFYEFIELCPKELFEFGGEAFPDWEFAKLYCHSGKGYGPPTFQIFYSRPKASCIIFMRGHFIILQGHDLFCKIYPILHTKRFLEQEQTWPAGGVCDVYDR